MTKLEKAIAYFENAIRESDEIIAEYSDELQKERWGEVMVKKQYGAADYYKRKLERVMERLGIEKYNYNFDRHGCWVEFYYKNELYRFDHSVEKARTKGIELIYGSDAFAQVVLALEDLTRMVERGIYDLSTWVAGMKYLPPAAVEVPSFMQFLGFKQIPSGPEEVKKRYRQLAKQIHPDVGGTQEDFEKLQRAAEQSLKYFGEKAGEYGTEQRMASTVQQNDRQPAGPGA